MLGEKYFAICFPALLNSAMDSRLSASDTKLLKLLSNSGGRLTTKEMSSKPDLSKRVTLGKRKRLEREYFIKTYSLDPSKFGFRQIDLLIHIRGGESMNIGRELLKREEVTHV